MFLNTKFHVIWIWFSLIFSARKKNVFFTTVFQTKAYERGNILSSNVIYFLNLEKKIYSNLFTERKNNFRVKSYCILKFDIFSKNNYIIFKNKNVCKCRKLKRVYSEPYYTIFVLLVNFQNEKNIWKKDFIIILFMKIYRKSVKI